MKEQAFNLYRDIAERTDGDVYIGVVGPVRTGKSTLISRLMQELVLAGMAPGPKRERLTDELPQSGSGKTIMTTQPKFVPGEAVTVTLGDQATVPSVVTTSPMVAWSAITLRVPVSAACSKGMS